LPAGASAEAWLACRQEGGRRQDISYKEKDNG